MPDRCEWVSAWIKTSRIEFYFFFLAPRVHLQSGWARCQNGAPDRAKTISLSPGAAQRFHMLCIHGGWQCIIWEKLMRKKGGEKKDQTRENCSSSCWHTDNSSVFLAFLQWRAYSAKRQAPHLVVECSARAIVTLQLHALTHYFRKCFHLSS